LSNVLKLTKTFDLQFSKESLIISSLLHDSNKYGSVQNPYYVPETEDWRLRKGYNYKINPKLENWFASGHRGLFLLQYFGVKLTEEEWLAILLNDGTEVDENRVYTFKEPKLAIIVHMADRWACQIEKDLNL